MKKRFVPLPTSAVLFNANTFGASFTRKQANLDDTVLLA